MTAQKDPSSHLLRRFLICMLQPRKSRRWLDSHLVKELLEVLPPCERFRVGWLMLLGIESRRLSDRCSLPSLH